MEVENLPERKQTSLRRYGNRVSTILEERPITTIFRFLECFVGNTPPPSCFLDLDRVHSAPNLTDILLFHWQ